MEELVEKWVPGAHPQGLVEMVWDQAALVGCFFVCFVVVVFFSFCSCFLTALALSCSISVLVS